jgi:hypothetical protein
MVQKDSYKSTGCYDLTCPGFVQTSNVISLGAAIVPVSTDSGPQTGFTVGIFLVIKIVLFSYIHFIIYAYMLLTLLKVPHTRP